MTNEPNDRTYSRIEDINFFLVNCTTAANYFHMFRRHAYMGLLRPLIVMSPKTLIRFQKANSPIIDIMPGTRFQKVIDEEYDGSSKKVIFCSGKVFYDLKKMMVFVGLKFDHH
ncbi:hypothetical protein ACOME3_007952 [Neoechinorhynchus agilis]